MGWVKDKLSSSSNDADELKTTIENIWLISGKTSSYWEQYFCITIPQDADSKTLANLGAKVGGLMSEATGYLSKTESSRDGIEYLYKDQYNATIDSMVSTIKNSGEKVPAAATLASLAEAKLSDLNGARQHTEMCVKFWKRTIDGLKKVGDRIDNITWNLSNEAKIVNNYS